jgi:hypothetical protein
MPAMHWISFVHVDCASIVCSSEANVFRPCGTLRLASLVAGVTRASPQQNIVRQR